MREIDKSNIKDLIENIETTDVKTESGKSFRILIDKRTGLIELQMEYNDFQNQNKGVKSDDILENEYQAYIKVVYFAR